MKEGEELFREHHDHEHGHSERGNQFQDSVSGDRNERSPCPSNTGDIHSECPKERYLCSLNAFVECSFDALNSVLCKRPRASSTTEESLTVTERLARTLYLGRACSTGRTDLRLPITSNILQVVSR